MSVVCKKSWELADGFASKEFSKYSADVTLNRGEATVRDLTGAERSTDADRIEYGACSFRCPHRPHRYFTPSYGHKALNVSTPRNTSHPDDEPRLPMCFAPVPTRRLRSA